MNLKGCHSAATVQFNFHKKLKIVKFLMLLTFLALLFCNMCIPITGAPNDNESTIKITYPSNESLVSIQQTVMGRAENLPQGQKLWVLVYPVAANKFYPQKDVNIIDGNWSLTVGVGDKENISETFKILAVLADKNAHEEFTNYFSTAPNTGWPGMENIPESAKVVDYITVTRLNPEINITPPSNVASINMKETINGTAKNVPSGYKLWILIHPIATTNFYPQKGNVQIINGKWSIPINIGVKEDVGETFEIIALLANEKAHEELTNYINTGNNNGYWPGIDSISEGSAVYSEITVIRKIEPMVNITSPLNTVKFHDIITGTAKYIPEGETVWILIFPQTANKYYPQNKVDLQDVNWILQAQFGIENQSCGGAPRCKQRGMSAPPLFLLM